MSLASATVKRCCTCKEFKSFDAFYNDVTQLDGKTRACRSCESLRTSASLLLHSEERKASRRRSAWLNKGVAGCDLQLAEALFQAQLGCFLCDEIGTCVDHNHKTGRVRGWLCSTCNVELGFLEKRLKTEWEEKALVFLQKTGSI